MKFRPCIDLHQGQVKQIVGSTLVDGQEAKENFVSSRSPADFSAQYKKDGLPGGHVIMLGKGNEEAALKALGAFPKGMHVGGGVNPQNAKHYLDHGASHVIVTSYVFQDGKIDFDRLKEMVDAVGADNLVLDLSCRKKSGQDGYFVVTDRWQKYTDFEVTEENLKKLAEYCNEFLVHGVDVEGMRVGVMEDLVEKLGMWSPIPVTYAGGARSLADFDLVKKLGNDKVDLTVGSALDIFGGDLEYSRVVKWHYANLFSGSPDGIQDDKLRQLVVAAQESLQADASAQDAQATFEKALQDSTL